MADPLPTGWGPGADRTCVDVRTVELFRVVTVRVETVYNDGQSRQGPQAVGTVRN